MVEFIEASIAQSTIGKGDPCQLWQSIDHRNDRVAVLTAVDDQFFEVRQMFKSRKVGSKEITVRNVGHFDAFRD